MNKTNFPCGECIYIGYDSCGEGYCCSILRAEAVHPNHVISDKGCAVESCEYFKKLY